MQIETVLVKGKVSDDNPTGSVVINKEDFVEGEHELFEAVVEVVAKAIPPAPPAPAAPWAPKK